MIGRDVSHFYLANTPPWACGETQLVAAFNRLAGAVCVQIVPLFGERYDCGSKFGCLEAIASFALDHAEYGEPFSELIAKFAWTRTTWVRIGCAA